MISAGSKMEARFERLSFQVYNPLNILSFLESGEVGVPLLIRLVTLFRN